VAGSNKNTDKIYIIQSLWPWMLV